MTAAWAETVPKRPLTASTGTCTTQSCVTPAAASESGVSQRSLRSESGAISSPSSAGVNIGRQRGSKSGSSPLCLKIPEIMSERTSAAIISAVKRMTLRHPSRRHTSQRISA